MKSLFTGAVLAAALAASPALAAGKGISENMLTSNQLLKFCSSSSTSNELFACEMYLQGARELVISDAVLNTLNKAVRAAGQTPTKTTHANVCAPADAGEKVFFDTAVAALREARDIGDALPAGLIVGNAWRDRWPCK
jgi:Rap1a immunity proteins